MPRFDRTGPGGAGPMTGWARGLCARVTRPFGFGGGRGRGCGRGAARSGRDYDWQLGEMAADDPLLSPDEERRLLKADRNRLKAQLDRTEERLREIGRQAKSETSEEGTPPDGN